MGAAQIAAIQPAVREWRDSLRNDPTGTEDLCLTISVPGRDAAWLQLMKDCVNFGFPYSENPLTFISRAGIPVPSPCILVGWEPLIFATISCDFSTDGELATFIDLLLIALHGLDPDDYEVDVQFEHL